MEDVKEFPAIKVFGFESDLQVSRSEPCRYVGHCHGVTPVKRNFLTREMTTGEVWAQGLSS